MDGGWAIVVAAVVTAVGGVLVALIQQFRKENRQDHDLVVNQIRVLYHLMRKVDDRVERHLTWHSEGSADEPERRTASGRKN